MSSSSTPPPSDAPPTGDLDDKFSEDDTSEYYGYDVAADEPLPIIRITIGALLIVGILSGIVYLAYIKGVQDGQKNLPPFVMADKAPVKIIPEAPVKDDKFERGDLEIYDKIQAPTGDMSGDMSGADNGNGDTESLYGEVETPMTEEVEATEEVEVEVEIAAPVPTKPAPSIANEITTEIGGAFVVQVSSTRRLAQATASFLALQKRFPDLMQGREPAVQRTDLGEKGIFFRLAIAEFATRAAAKEFCATLKSRGQDCLIRKVK